MNALATVVWATCVIVAVAALAFRALDRLVAVMHRVRVVRMGGAVVRPALRSALHVQLRRVLRHLQGALRLGYLIVRRSRVAIQGVAERILRAADLRLAARERVGRALALDPAGLHRQAVIVRVRNVRVRQRRAVVLLRGVAARQGNRTLRHAQGAHNVRALRVERLVLHRPRERVGHRRLGHVRDRRRRRIVAVMHRVRVVRMGCAVVRPTIRRALHVQLRRALRHLQGALRLRDIVVRRSRVAVQGVAERIRAAADLRLAARERVGRALALDPAGLHRQAVRVGALHVRVRQLRAVVLLRCTAARQGHRSRRDAQSAHNVRALRVERLVRNRPCERVGNRRLRHVRDRVNVVWPSVPAIVSLP